MALRFRDPGLFLVGLFIAACSSHSDGSAFRPFSVGGASGDASGDRGGAADAAWTTCITVPGPGLPDHARIYLVVDTSESMGAPTATGATKWEATRDALRTFVADVPPWRSLGLELFPNGLVATPADGGWFNPCANMALLHAEDLGDAGSVHRQEIDAAIWSVIVGGPKPTQTAWSIAAGSALGQLPSIVVLISDGHPTLANDCSGDGSALVDGTPIVQALDLAYDFGTGVPTYVVGLPGSENSVGSFGAARSWMSAGASVAGTGTEGCQGDGPNYCHVDLSNAVDLRAALTDALRRIEQSLSCTSAVPPGGADLDRVRVWLIPSSGEEIALAHDTSAQCADGFRYNTERTAVVLCPSTCDRVRSDVGTQIRVEFDCR